MKHPVKLLLAAAFVFASVPGWAGLDGTQVKGSLTFNNNPKIFNYFDPNNGFVPPGFKNDSGTTVTIGPGELDFGATVGTNAFTANFTNTQLKITEMEGGGPSPAFMMTFIDPAFLSITKVFDNFDHGGISFRLVGDEIVLSRQADPSGDDNFMAIFDIGSSTPPPTIPEPGSLVLLGTGLLGAAYALHNKFVA